jgi:hypothetical protein
MTCSYLKGSQGSSSMVKNQQQNKEEIQEYKEVKGLVFN